MELISCVVYFGFLPSALNVEVIKFNQAFVSTRLATTFLTNYLFWKDFFQVTSESHEDKDYGGQVIGATHDFLRSFRVEEICDFVNSMKVGIEGVPLSHLRKVAFDERTE